MHFGGHQEAYLPDRAAILDAFIDSVAKLPKNLKPNILVVSGDIAGEGKPENFNEAETFLKELKIIYIFQ